MTEHRKKLTLAKAHTERMREIAKAGEVPEDEEDREEQERVVRMPELRFLSHRFFWEPAKQ